MLISPEVSIRTRSGPPDSGDVIYDSGLKRFDQIVNKMIKNIGWSPQVNGYLHHFVKGIRKYHPETKEGNKCIELSAG